ncbi:MAG: hypothetical protein QOG90_460 [Actinomycetota bacterium]|jgi:hypothetical protein
MSAEPNLSKEDLQAQEGAAIPDKEAMSLLDVNVDLDLSLDLAAPIDAAVAANANAGAPIDAAAGANVLSPDAIASAQATQSSGIVQDLHGVADATANQSASIDQGGTV